MEASRAGGRLRRCRHVGIDKVGLLMEGASRPLPAVSMRKWDERMCGWSAVGVKATTGTEQIHRRVDVLDHRYMSDRALLKLYRVSESGAGDGVSGGWMR